MDLFESEEYGTTQTSANPAPEAADIKEADISEKVLSQMQSRYRNAGPLIVDEPEILSVYVPENGSAINIYENQDNDPNHDPENPRAWMVLEQETLNLRGMTNPNNPMSFMKANNVRTTRKSCIRSGKVSDLKKEFALIKAGRFPNARIQTVEFLESKATEMKENLKPESFERRLKRAGNTEDAPYVTFKGEKIVRMTLPDYLGNQPDFLIQHDNHKELSAFAKERIEIARSIKASSAANGPILESKENGEITEQKEEETAEA